MYCVICGRQLTYRNQHGIVCHCCHAARITSKRLLKETISVNYCYTCGELYAPRDTSIQHRACVWGSLRLTVERQAMPV